MELSWSIFFIPKQFNLEHAIGVWSFVLNQDSSSFQKVCINLHSQKRCRRLSVSRSQKVHLSDGLFPILWRKLLVAILLCINLYWKLVNFVLMVALKGRLYTSFQLTSIWFLIFRSLSHFDWLIVGCVCFFSMRLE